MEMRSGYKWMVGLGFCALLLLLSAVVKAQPSKAYTIKNGRMYIQLPKQISKQELATFVEQFDLADLGLEAFLQTNKADSLLRQGWKIETNNEIGVVISKKLEAVSGLGKIDDKIIFNEKLNMLFPAVNNGIIFGVNRFRNKQSFLVADLTVRFFLRGNLNASRVALAGSFNQWTPDQLFMKKTDSGWIYTVKLGPGKYWYKFIVDGSWTVDKDNLLSENDGLGNVNSVFFRSNVLFALPGFTSAKKVFLSGSFNNWKPDGLAMKQTATGWELPVYLAEGTHAYKFVVDGRWYADERNAEKVPDGHGEYNSVVRLGKSHLFKLNGYQNAREVMLVGSFNQWREFEWQMKKTASGWELPYTLGPGNYEYKFRVDGKWIADPANTMSSPTSGNSFLILRPNYTFHLKAFKNAKQVYLAGDFNGWDPKAFAMKKEGDEWIFPVHLSVGKHLYKLVVDGQWLIDPTNKLWEQNEYSTGNSIIWIEQ